MLDESVFVFDLIPPCQYVGEQGCQKDFEGFFAES